MNSPWAGRKEGGGDQRESFQQNPLQRRATEVPTLEKYEKQYDKTGSNNRTKSSGLELGPEGFNPLPPPPTFLSMETSPTPTAPCPPYPISLPHPFLLLWGQGLPGLLVPKHRPTSTLRHQNIWSPPVSPPVIVRGLLRPGAPPDFPSLLPSFHIVENTYFLYSGDQSLSPVSCGPGGHGVILSGPQFPLGAVAGLD